MIRAFAWFLLCVTGALFLVSGILIIPPMVERILAPEIRPVTEGSYLPRPGNRFKCEEKNYIGYIAVQADGSDRPVKYTCLYK